MLFYLLLTGEDIGRLYSVGDDWELQGAEPSLP